MPLQTHDCICVYRNDYGDVSITKSNTQKINVLHAKIEKSINHQRIFICLCVCVFGCAHIFGVVAMKQANFEFDIFFSLFYLKTNLLEFLSGPIE